MIKTFDDLTYRVSEDTRLVVVTVRMDRVHAEISHIEKKKESFSLKKGLKSTKITGGVPGTFHRPTFTFRFSVVFV